MPYDHAPIGPKIKLAFTFEEAADASGYSVDTIRRAVRSHDLIARYANTKPVIRVSELDDWLASLPTEPGGKVNGPSEMQTEHRRSPVTEASDVLQSERSTPLFRTPEEAARLLGVSKSAVRGYCRASGIYTKVGKRVMLHDNDIPQLVEWIRDRKSAENDWTTEPADPFTKRR